MRIARGSLTLPILLAVLLAFAVGCSDDSNPYAVPTPPGPDQGSTPSDQAMDDFDDDEFPSRVAGYVESYDIDSRTIQLKGCCDRVLVLETARAVVVPDGKAIDFDFGLIDSKPFVRVSGNQSNGLVTAQILIISRDASTGGDVNPYDYDPRRVVEGG